MDRRQSFKRLVRLEGQREKNAAPILVIRRAEKKVSLHKPVHQADGRMVLEQKVARKLSNCDAFVRGKPPHCQKGLVLLRREPGFSCSLFAKGKKTA